jgi:hypothetical protein
MVSERPATSTLRCGGLQLRAQGIARGDGLVVLRARNQLLADQRVQAPRIGLGLLELGLDVGHLRARLFELRGRQRTLGIGIHRVERGHHLALLHAHAFFDEHLAHLAGDLGRYRGHAPGDDIAAGVQHRRAFAAGGNRRDRRGAHVHRLVPQHPPRAGTGQRDDGQHAEHDPRPAPGRRRRRGLAVDAQFFQQIGGGAHRVPWMDVAGPVWQRPAAATKLPEVTFGSGGGWQPVSPGGACTASDSCHLARMRAATAACMRRGATLRATSRYRREIAVPPDLSPSHMPMPPQAGKAGQATCRHACIAHDGSGPLAACRQSFPRTGACR